jgi:adenosylcobinamide-GDP ribazoletransferase
MNSVRHFLLAVQFFTRIPITGKLANFANFSPEALRQSAAHFPGVGWIVGFVCAGSFWSLSRILPHTPATPWVCAFLSTTLGVLLTGGFHEDGLADLADGLGGAADRDRALEIMKDSRIGSFGTLALILALLGKCAMLSMLAHVDWFLASLSIFAAHVSSRTAPLFIISSLEHIGDIRGSKSKPLADAITRGALIVGVLWCALALALAAWAVPSSRWRSGVVCAALSALWIRRMLQRRLGGFTGDGLGATQQVSELAFYLGVGLG